MESQESRVKKQRQNLAEKDVAILIRLNEFTQILCLEGSLFFPVVMDGFFMHYPRLSQKGKSDFFFSGKVLTDLR